DSSVPRPRRCERRSPHRPRRGSPRRPPCPWSRSVRRSRPWRPPRRSGGRKRGRCPGLLRSRWRRGPSISWRILPFFARLGRRGPSPATSCGSPSPFARFGRRGPSPVTSCSSPGPFARLGQRGQPRALAAAVAALDGVVDDAALGLLGQIRTLEQLFELALGARNVGLVREVGGEEQGAVTDALDGRGQRGLTALAAEVELAGGDVLARLLLEPLRELLVLGRRPHLVA